MKKENGFMQNFIKAGSFRKVVIIAGALIAVIVLLILLAVFRPAALENTGDDAQVSAPAVDTTSETVVVSTKQSETEIAEPTSDVQSQDQDKLAELAILHEQNPDLAGWIHIEDTVVDYPVMFTPEDGEKYIYADFKGKFDKAGLPFIEDDCSMEPESDNIIIYGHNMKNGSMFASLMDYEKRKYWEEHPIISFSTLSEEREYEIVAAFYDKVYYEHETCFKFYQFINAENEAHFEEAYDYYKKKALYDTGVTAEYGDRLLTLVTCAYHIENGRFVVVAREKQDYSS